MRTIRSLGIPAMEQVSTRRIPRGSCSQGVGMDPIKLYVISSSQFNVSYIQCRSILSDFLPGPITSRYSESFILWYNHMKQQPKFWVSISWMVSVRTPLEVRWLQKEPRVLTTATILLLPPFYLNSFFTTHSSISLFTSQKFSTLYLRRR